MAKITRLVYRKNLTTQPRNNYRLTRKPFLHHKTCKKIMYFFLKMSWVVPESCLPTIIFHGRTVKFRGCSREYDAYCRCFSFCLLKAGCARKNTEVSLPSFRETSVDEQPKDSWKQQFTPLGSHFLQSFQII